MASKLCTRPLPVKSQPAVTKISLCKAMQRAARTWVSWLLPSPSFTSLTCSRRLFTRFFSVDSCALVNLSILAICTRAHTVPSAQPDGLMSSWHAASCVACHSPKPGCKLQALRPSNRALHQPYLAVAGHKH